MQRSRLALKVLVLAYTHTLSHLSRCLAVAVELRAQGHDVVFAGESPKTSFITDQGFSVLPCHEPDPELLFDNIRSGRIRFADEAEISRMIEADIDTIQTVRPDLVLSDGRFTAAVSTHIAGVRHAAIVNVSSTEYRAHPYIPFFEWIPAGFVSRNSDTWNLLDRLNLKLEMTLFDRVMNVFTKLSRQYRLPHPVTATNCLAGKDITLLADIPEYFPTRNLPSSYHYVGPLTWKSTAHKPEWWPPEQTGVPLAYITMGTTGVPELFDAIADLMPTATFRAIVTTGGQRSKLSLLKGKTYVEPFLDGDLVMEQSDLVICHGGNGTIYQALSHGIPIIGIPTIPDQQFNMRRVEALGVGKLLGLKELLLHPSRLAELVDLLLKDASYRNNSQKMQNILNNYDAAKTSARILTGGTA
jgi:UDP:flavonoid glycosyltransferase YjiC (YdhE family)